jgi:hypothetical protein
MDNPSPEGHPMPTITRLDVCLKRVYDYQLEALICPHAEQAFALDWPAINRSTAEVLRRIGMAVWFVGREPMSEADDSPFVVVELDRATGMVWFGVATVDELPAARPASVFDEDGRPIDD